MFKNTLVLAMGCSALLLGCASEEAQTPAEENQEIIDNLIEAGFPENDIMIADGKVYVGRDAHVTLAASREMLQPVSETQEQYRTTNLVGTGVTNICINGASFTGNFSTGLNNAIANYNALGLRWRMTRTSGSTSGCSAVITARISSGTGGSAGFPSGGLPYNTINIGSGLSSYSVGVIEHVITHELGHCVGFRHSDYYNRSISCGSGGNEGSAGVGAILIPGTPSTATVGGSLMNSCFRSTENGNFKSSDITALNALY
jgi:hypothetical protein